MKPTCAVLICCIAIAACARDSSSSANGPRGPWRTERLKISDTTVVRISNILSADAELQLSHDLTIGKAGDAAAALFGAVGYVVPHGPGVLVFDSQAEIVRRFDSTGELIGNLGARGMGPAEYDAVRRIDVLDGDTIAIWSGGTRIKLFAPDGGYAGDMPIPGADGRAFITPLRVARNARIFRRGSVNDPLYPDSLDRFGEPLTIAAAIRYNRDGEALDTAIIPRATRPQSRFRLDLKGGDFRGFAPIPFFPYFVAVFGPSGYWVSGEGDRYAIAMHRPGAPLRIETDAPRIGVKDAERQAMHARFAFEVARYDAVAVPTLSLVANIKPFFSALQFDQDGRLWVKVHSEGARQAPDTVTSAKSINGTPLVRPGEVWREPQVYHVFSADGEFLGRATLPENATFADARGNKLWLILRDADDVQTVARYTVIPASAPLRALFAWEPR